MLKLPPTTIALIIVCSGSIIGPLGMAGVNIAIPNLAEDLNASAKMIAWMPTLYLLSSVMFMLPCGKIAQVVTDKYNGNLLQLSDAINSVYSRIKVTGH